uniref:Head-tail joining protein n=1 Tax=viral metagenome TaxID=1070528 RepID=A0A6M3XUA1_9ZZZZ
MGFATARSGAVASVFNNMGAAATFIPLSGDAVSCTVRLKHEDAALPGGYEALVQARKYTIRYQISDINRNVYDGEYFEISGTRYYCGEMIDTENPDLTRKVAVTIE